MQSLHDEPHALSVTVLTPADPPVTFSCDSLRLPLRADRRGEGEGSVGIRPGHAAAMLSLAPGTLLARRGEETVLSLTLSEGFASVEKDRVTVICEEVKKT